MKTQHTCMFMILIILFALLVMFLMFVIDSVPATGQTLIPPTNAPAENCLNDYTTCTIHIYVPLILKGD